MAESHHCSGICALESDSHALRASCSVVSLVFGRDTHVGLTVRISRGCGRVCPRPQSPLSVDGGCLAFVRTHQLRAVAELAEGRHLPVAHREQHHPIARVALPARLHLRGVAA